MNQLDSLAHAWDIGSALGLEVTLPDALCEAAMRTARIRVPLGRRRVFGAEIAAVASAGSGERLLAYTGRDPAAWLRPGTP